MSPREQSWVEEMFGRFAWREEARRIGLIEILGEWERQNIVSIAPPVALRDGQGRAVELIYCHRRIATPLRRTLGELGEQQLGHLVNTFDGCFVSRHMGWDPKRPLSRHAWGIAVDLNARLFPYGSRKQQDARLVAAFAKQGFCWGGEWGKPDPMHFEMARLTEPEASIQILVDGEHVASGFVQEGRVMAPVREIAEALGAVVEARMKEGEVEIYRAGGEW